MYPQPRQIPDPQAVKPEGWLDYAPQKIPDPSGSKPEDWDDEEVSRRRKSRMQEE